VAEGSKTDHWANITELADYGESSGTGPWIKLKMTLPDMSAWRGNKGDIYTITCCLVRQNIEGDHELVKDVIWRNDGQMLGFGESDASGCWVKFRVEPRDLDFFRGNKGQDYYWKFIDVNKLEGVVNAQQRAKHDKGPYGKDVQRLHKYGFFRAKAVWEAIGSDDAYQAWTRTQPCIVTGGVDWDEKSGTGRTEYAHVRRAGDSGTAHKGEYSGVPLVHEIHANYQHQHGETAAYKYYIDRNRRKLAITPELAKAWFDKKAMENVEKWAHETLCKKLGTTSLTMVEPTILRKWAEDNNLTQYLPKNYREA
jgi:hypothetical protein